MKILNNSTPKILFDLANSLGTEVKNGRVDIPKQFGSGYCAGFVFYDKIRILILNYELKEELIFDNPEFNLQGKMILFKFQNVFPFEDDGSPRSIPSVLIATSRLNSDSVISIQNNTSSVNIEIEVGYLNELFDLTNKSVVLQSLSQNSQPLLFEQVMISVLQKNIDEIIAEPLNKNFEWIFRKIKAEELIFRLLMELEKREEKQLYPLNGHDLQAIYNAKEQLLKQLSMPPRIRDLAVDANMSPTKLKTLFKQIFGDSIFSYYQGFRMQEAARLLKEKKLSVSEVGYQLGFSNLSHFSRVFREHIGMKPKQYSRS